VQSDDQQVTISIQPFRNKWKTSVVGLAEAHKDLHSLWKKKLSCGGDFKDGLMTFQGDHSHIIYEWIVAMGYSRDRIVVAGNGK